MLTDANSRVSECRTQLYETCYVTVTFHNVTQDTLYHMLSHITIYGTLRAFKVSYKSSKNVYFASTNVIIYKQCCNFSHKKNYSLNL